MRADRGQRRTDPPQHSPPPLYQKDTLTSNPAEETTTPDPTTHPNHPTLTPSTKNPTSPRHTPAWQKVRGQERAPGRQPDPRTRHSLSDGPESPHPYMGASTPPKTPQRGSHVLPEGIQHPSPPVADRSTPKSRTPTRSQPHPNKPLIGQQPSASNSTPPATPVLHPQPLPQGRYGTPPQRGPHAQPAMHTGPRTETTTQNPKKGIRDHTAQ